MVNHRNYCTFDYLFPGHVFGGLLVERVDPTSDIGNVGFWCSQPTAQAASKKPAAGAQPAIVTSNSWQRLGATNPKTLPKRTKKDTVFVPG